jgi:hypothetical protein
MARHSLDEVLRKHRERSAARHRRRAPHRSERREEEKQGSPVPKHVLLTKNDAKLLFLDLPKTHKFWLADGREINNLTELYRELIEMSGELFDHHVTNEKNDFAQWVNDVLHDTILARKLANTPGKLEHVEIVKARIDELKYRGMPIPKPNTKLQPDYSFIEVEHQRRGPEPPRALERSFHIRPAHLMPDTSFIEMPTHKHEVAMQYDRIMNTQMAVMNTVQRGQQSQHAVGAELSGLQAQFEGFSKQIAALKEELTGLKGTVVEKGEKEEQFTEAYLSNLRETIGQLRDRERTILAQIKHAGAVEEKIAERNEQLMRREQELADKESLVVKKEDAYTKLMKRYNDMLAQLERRMNKDEQKIQTLLKVDMSIDPVPRNEARPTLSVKDLLGQTMVRQQEEEKREHDVTEALTVAKEHAAKRQWKDARSMLAKAETLLKSPHLSNEFKKNAYYQIFELTTDLDLQEK